jgi:hypothetical protein
MSDRAGVTNLLDRMEPGRRADALNAAFVAEIDRLRAVQAALAPPGSRSRELPSLSDDLKALRTRLGPRE